MPVVFVHGVNNRKGPEYDAGVLAKTAFFRKHLAGAVVNGKQLGALDQVWFPYWGDLGTTFAWEMASLPKPNTQALGGAADPTTAAAVGHLRDALGPLAGTTAAREPLTELARRDLNLAVDVVTRMVLAGAEAGKEAEVADFVVRASGYAADNPHPAWVATVQSDDQLLAELDEAIAVAPAGPRVQPLGRVSGWVADKLAGAGAELKRAAGAFAGKAADKVGDYASTKLLGWTRESLNATLGRFFGDVFIYMNSRGDQAHPGPIPKLVTDAIDEAVAKSPKDEPLVVVGHSLGGVITMDLLGHFRPDVQVDLLVTVGSQVAHFEEIKLYKNSVKTVVGPAGRAVTPPNVHRWINVFDEVDIFSYAVQDVFDRVNFDVSYDTKTYVVKAHGAYFEQDEFYRRLRARIGALP